MLAVWGLGDARWPVIIAFGLAYLFFPIVQKLEKWGIHRNWAVLAVFIGSSIFNIGLLVLIIPNLVSDLQELLSELPQTAETAFQQIENLIHLSGFNINFSAITLKTYFLKHAQELSSEFLKTFTSGFSIAFSGVSKWILSLINIFLMPIFFFYFVSDFEKINSELESYIPQSVKGSFRNYLEDMNRILKGYLRGQFLVAIILAFLYSIGLAIVGVRFGFLIGILTGLLSFIPYVGFITGVLLSLLMTIANFQGFPQLMGLLVVFGLVQALESFVITPRLVGNSVGLTPLVSLLALLIGGNVLGLLGMLIAIPTAAFLKIILKDLKDEYQEQ